MMLAFEDNHEPSMKKVFDKYQCQSLQMMNMQMEGETEKIKNHSTSNTLKWASQIIAGLGGCKGYRSQRKPRPIIL